MIIGVPREIKNNEYRVAIVPAGVRELVDNGHRVLIQKSAGEGSGITDKDYISCGARIKNSAEAIFKEAEMIVKVKEPQPQEYELLGQGQVLFTYLHLASAPALTRSLLKSKIIGIAYETVQLDNGVLPLLTPMSEIAGRLSIQVGARYLEKENGGSGVLLGGVPGVRPGNVAIIGGGTVGLNAAKVAVGMGANVSIMDVSMDRLRYLSDILHGRVNTLASDAHSIESAVVDADLVIGATLIPGARAKKLLSKEMVAKMRKGSVIVDVSIDQGGCSETCHPTDFDHPTFVFDGVIHYCVTNMPSSVARSSTFALTNATIPYVLKLANLGWKDAVKQDAPLRKGVNILSGKLVNKAVAESLKLKYTPMEAAMGSF